MKGFFCSLLELDLSKINQPAMRLTDAPFDLVHEGHRYQSTGALLKIGKITKENTISSKELSITLSGASMEMQEAINTNIFRRAPIKISKAFVPEGANNVQQSVIYYRGFTSTPETDINEKEGYLAMNITCKSLFNLDQKPSLSRSNNATHQAYHKGDKFFQYANVEMDDDVMWREP